MEQHLAQIAQYILLGIGINTTALLGIIAGIIYLTIYITRATRDIATMTREVAFMIRRQYADIDRDLQEIKDLLRGQ